ncbi:hypothetical protein SAMN05216466_10683 [Paraburkholderia phenazinium]|uniref:Uncharacterized protein n=1 Tax=Paraburkholderia phenazinium TaxID=60549 RepID=A0A1G7Y917_9BURK|nr:hypothetical protein SAMN05216466_10683 [Paraburkholderia phenazinium]
MSDHRFTQNKDLNRHIAGLVQQGWTLQEGENTR